MAVLPMLKMTGGLHTGPLTAGPDHCVDSINFMSAGGSLVKRSGMTPVRNITGLRSACYVGTSAGTAEPSAVSTGAGSYYFSSNHNTVYVGATLKFNAFNIRGVIGFYSSIAGFYNWYSVTPEYWNGSVWDVLDVGWMDTKVANSAGIYIGPMFNFGTTSTGTMDLMRGVFAPPQSWATKTVAGQLQYWIRIRNLPLPPQLNSNFIVAPNGASTWVQTTENRILNVLPFRDRRGTRHLFIAYLFGAGGRELRYELDGVVLSQSTGLQPDGSETAGTGSRMFSKKTRVSSYYHAATDRVIGHVQGLGWFYFPATTITSARAGSIYSLAAGSGVNTPYDSLAGGLRSAIPSGTISVFHDGRFFAFEEQAARWSSPTVYPDIWPNDNELFLADSGGDITGAASVGGVLAVFKRSAIWIMQSDGTSDGYIAYLMPGNVGCVATRSIVTVGNVVYFLSHDGVYSFDAQTVRKISGNIDGIVGTPSFSSNAEDAVGVWSPQYNQYRLFYRSAGSSDVLDAALYCDVSDPSAPRWWKQGKYVDGTTYIDGYGFNATAMAADSTTDGNKILLGDAYGVLWECDSGLRDGGSIVRARLVSQRIGLGSTRKALVRWVNVTQKNGGNYTWTVAVWAEGKEDEGVTHTYNPSALSNAGTFGGFGTFSTNTHAYVRDRQVVQGSFAQLGRHFQIEIIESQEAPLEIDAIEVDANPLGRRGP